VIAVARLRVTSRGGISLDRAVANLYELDAGRLRGVTAFADREEAVRAAAER
jgi:hypothetical protein